MYVLDVTWAERMGVLLFGMHALKTRRRCVLFILHLQLYMEETGGGKIDVIKVFCFEMLSRAGLQSDRELWRKRG